MLRTVTARADRFELSSPFRISRAVKTAADVVTVEIACGAHRGRGEGVPYPRYGETTDSALVQIEAVRAALEQGADRHALLSLMPAGAARNAVDCALWDLDARQAGCSVPEMLGLPAPGAIATAITVSLDTPEAMAAAAAKLADAPLIKIKVDGVEPMAAVRAVRAAAPKPKVIVDPNESWTFEQVAAFQEEMVALRIDLLEQPLPADADDALAGFVPLVPLAADESVHVAEDVSRLAGRYQVVNIKLDKSGGLTGALALADAAEAQGFGLMTGSMICSSLSIAPALVVAARCSFVDLDGPLWLRADYEGGITSDHGMLSLPGPGFWGGL